MRHVAERHDEPLSEPVFMILLSLAAEPRHGYAILKDVENVSSGRLRLSTGTLYGAIRRLLDEKWIERIIEDEAPRERQTYRLTHSGREVLASEVSRMKDLARAASLRLSRGDA